MKCIDRELRWRSETTNWRMRCNLSSSILRWNRPTSSRYLNRNLLPAPISRAS